MRSDSCPFCRIADGNAAAQLLYESAESLAFLDIHPINPGHALVITKEHYENFLDVPPHVLNDVVDTLRLVSEAITESLKPEGLNIFNNNGAVAGQSVFHFHFHVTPRYENDGLKIRPLLRNYTSMDEMAECADKIRLKIKMKDKSGERI